MEWLPGVRPARNPVVYLPAAKPLLDVIGVAGLCLLPGVGGAIAALVVRFRRSRGIERQQLKWFTSAAALAPLPFLVYEVAPGAFGLLLAVTLPLVPISVGIAILRYRLYEIDRIINRTLVYGLLTAILGLGYAAGSLVSILVVGVGSGPPSWLVAAATLAAAAVFRPARRRIQAVVDRRFNRRRYNAARTIQAFSGRLREQIDLDTLSSEVLAVVDQTMEPTRASLWLRPSAPGSSGTLGLARFDGHPPSGALPRGGCPSWTPWNASSLARGGRSRPSSRLRSWSCASAVTARSGRSPGTSI